MIAIYPGSFNPYHRGHEDIRKKAEAIFGKVIICRGQNPTKIGSNYPMPKLGSQIMNYSGLLTEFIKKRFDEEVVVIRGLRNPSDLQYELTQFRYLEDQMPNIKVVSLFCSRELEHISSSAIRQLDSYNQGGDYHLPLVNVLV
jgi:cytidyltransferase-like protein